MIHPNTHKPNNRRSFIQHLSSPGASQPMVRLKVTVAMNHESNPQLDAKRYGDSPQFSNDPHVCWRLADFCYGGQPGCDVEIRGTGYAP